MVINSQTIAPNAPPVTINHTPVALGTAGLIIGGPSTVEVQSPQPTLAVIGNSPALIDTSGNVVVDNQIITPEAPAVTIHNTPVHLDSAGLVVGSASPIVVTNVPHTTPLATIGNSPVVVDESGNVKVSDQIIAPGVPVTINNTPVSLGTDGLVFGTASTVAVDSSPHYVVGSQRLSPGGAPVIHLGTTYSLAPHATAIVVNGAASAATPVGSSLPVLTIGNSVITPESNSHYIVAGETLAPNGPPLTVSGSTYSLAHDAGAIVVDGITSTFPSPTENVLPILTFGGSPLTPGPSSRYILGGQTLTPGSAAIQISGTTYSLAPDAAAVVVNGITSPLPKPSPTGLPVLTVGDSLRSPDAHSHYIVAGQTLSPGDAPVQISGTTYSIAPKATAVVVNGVTVSSTPTPPPVVNIGASPITANLNSEYVIGSQTLSPAGAPVTVSGTTYSLASHATAIIINGISSAIAAPSQLPLLNIGSSFITANSNSEYIVGSQTLTPAGTPITVSGTTYSLAPHAAAIVVNGISSAITAPSQLPMLNIGSSLLTANSRSEYIIGSQTLAPAGTPIIVSGATYSLASEASAIIINGISTPIVNPSSLPVLNIGSSLITANSNSKYVIGTQTLTPGSAITIPAHTIPATTVSGTTIPATTFPATTLSLSPSAHFLVFNGHTSSLTPSLPASNPLATATSEPRLGAIIYNGFGANPSPSFFTAGGQVFTPSPSSFAIAGTTLVAGGPALTISGTVVSLAPSGTLRIGTSIIPLSTSTSGFSTTAHNTSSSPTASSQALNISASSAPQSAEAEPGRRSVSSAGLVVALGMAVLIAM